MEDFKKVRDFLARGSTRESKHDRLRVFLATVEKPKYGVRPISEVILDLEMRLQKDGKSELSDTLFAQYSKLMESIERESAVIA
jgi:hypothetical protein